ncbi:MAG: MraZ N-terminal domain-containing protein [Myxococcota bacterium]
MEKPEWLSLKTQGVRVDKQGRCVLPAKLRRELGILPDEVLVAWAQDGRILLASQEEAFRYIGAQAKKGKKRGRTR